MTELMTLEELANYLRVTTKTVYRLLKKNGIPATKVGSHWRFDVEAIDKWLTQHSVGVKATILIVDDEEMIRFLFKETLEDLGHNVLTAKDGWEGLELLKANNCELVFIDLKMPGMDGNELLTRMKALKPHIPVTIITGYPDSDTLERALSQGPFGVMSKPFGESDIIAAVNNFLRITEVDSASSNDK